MSNHDENEIGSHEGESTGGDSSLPAQTYIGAGASESGDGGDDAVIASDSKPGLSRGTLVMFGVLVLGAGGLYGMYRFTGPKAASASVAKETAEANKTISTFLNGGDSSIKTMEALIRNTEKVVQQFLAYPSMTQIPLSDLRTNPFRAQEEKAADSSASDVNDRKKREEERLAILKAVQSMQLQSIMYSDARKVCMINNTLYREGQTMDNFTIEKINPASVVVKNGPYRFELRMQK